MLKWIETYFFKKFQEQNVRHYVLDPSCIIDGRIIALFKHDNFDGEIIIPSFIVTMLKQMAASDLVLKSSKGIRALTILEQFKKSLWKENREYKIIDKDYDLKTIDEKLIQFCKERKNNILITMNGELSKIAKAHSIKVLNIHMMINDLQETVVVGDKYTVKLVGPGKDRGQCIAYLKNNMLVCVNDSSQYNGKTVPIVIKNVLSTDNGKIAFAELQWEG